ncbi:branched-chain amino acid ABC transporter substrate-binding protein [Hydrogenophaga sp. MI9]|uniref:branched-chain amino acid ABC transporter substrate-binding protein n=1 Tax=Hydrogenophaga sp. MI9 TaxID=3453719 RepID=UPI003EED04D1
MTSLLLLALSTLSAHADEAPDLRIAVVVPLSSPIRHVAQEALNGAALGAKAGAIRLKSSPDRPAGGKFKVRLDFFDDKANPETAQTVARTIVADGHYDAVVGGINSGTAMPAATIYEQAGLLNVSLAATNPLLTRSGHRWTLRMAMDDEQLARNTYRVLSGRFQDQPALFAYDDTAYGELTANGFSSAHRSFSGQDVAPLNLGLNGDGDLSGLQTVGGSAAVLYLGGMDRFAIKVVGRLPRNVRWTIVSGDGVCSDPMAQETARLGMTLVCTSQDRKDSVPPSDSAFAQTYQSQYGKPPGDAASSAFDAVTLLVETLGQQGNGNRALVRDHLKSGGRLVGGEGPVAFDARGDNTLAPAYLYEAENGVLKFKQALR